MLKNFKNIIAGKKISKKSDEDLVENDNPIASFVGGSKKVSSLLLGYFSSLVSDVKVMKVKSRNLLQTNINLGLKHLNADRVSDAIFRFRIIAFLWPNHVKTYYYLAHCYVIKGRYLKAKKYLEILLKMDPSYESKVANMINKIDEGLYEND